MKHQGESYQRWYVKLSGGVLGPLHSSQVDVLARSGVLETSTPLWRAGEGKKHAIKAEEISWLPVCNEKPTKVLEEAKAEREAARKYKREAEDLATVLRTMLLESRDSEGNSADDCARESTGMESLSGPFEEQPTTSSSKPPKDIDRDDPLRGLKRMLRVKQESNREVEEVERAVKEVCERHKSIHGMPLPIHKQFGTTYSLGGRRFHLKILDGRLCVKVGAGHETLEGFLEKRLKVRPSWATPSKS